jgi:hypothetical protein
MDRSPAVTNSPDCRLELPLSRTLRERLIRGDRGGDGVGTLITHFVILHRDLSSGSRDSCRTRLIVPPLVDPVVHRPLQAVDLGSQSGIPVDLILFPQPALWTYLILNSCRYRSVNEYRAGSELSAQHEERVSNSLSW